MLFYLIFTTLLNLALGFAAAMFLLRSRSANAGFGTRGGCEELIVESPLVAVPRTVPSRMEPAPRPTHEAVELEDRPLVQWQVEPSAATANEPALANS